jgi:helix-turn-helix protein
MSDGEEALADAMGRFARVVVDGHKVPDLEWTSGRILLSNKRLLLVSEDGKETIPLSKVHAIKGRQDVGANPAGISGYVSVQTGSDVTLVAPAEEDDSVELALYAAVLDGQVILANHPAVEGGVVQDGDWTKGRLAVDAGEIGLALGDGRFVEIDVDDVGRVEEHDHEVRGDERLVLEAEHTEAGTAVETHVTGTRRHMSILGSLLRKGEQANTADVDLAEDESEVLMALYSGVSPFQIPEFVGMDVDRVEAIYDDLVEAGLLEEVRTRRDVSLKARGRSIASEEMAQE